MSIPGIFKKSAPLAFLIYSQIAFTQCFEPIGIIGGASDGSTLGYVGLIGPSGSILSLQNGPNAIPTNAAIGSVAINETGYSIIAGKDFSGSRPAYAALISDSGAILNLSAGSNALPETGILRSAAINDSGHGLVGGNYTSPEVAYAALISPSGAVSNLPTGVGALPSLGIIYSVAINNSKYGIIGGADAASGGAYAALISPSGTVSNLPTGTGSLPTGGGISSVAINNSGYAIIGGRYFSGTGYEPAYAALVSPSGAVSNLPTGPGAIPPTEPSSILSVAINTSGYGIIGGGIFSGDYPAYAALVSPTGVVSNLSNGVGALPTTGYINSVAINDSGYGLIGGNDQSGSVMVPYAALVSPSGALTNLGPFPSSTVNFQILSVAINEFGAGLIGGEKVSFPASENGYAALVTPNGQLIQLALPNSFAAISSVSMIRALSQIPTQCLGGNNLTLAKFINKKAPEKAFYFLPALFDGTLNQALESVSPTRNAAALFTTSNNLFMLNQSLSRHLRGQRHFLYYEEPEFDGSQTANSFYPEDQLFVLLDSEEYDEDLIVDAHMPASHAPLQSKSAQTFPPYAIWAQTLGSFSYQKKEHQTPAFDPTTGGLILGLEANLDTYAQVGGGAAYTYTHIRQHERSGHADIDQEYLFAYGFWNKNHFYLDAAIWGGIFHIHQVRKIHMTGFEFRSTSNPKGWQISPHVELGLDYTFWKHWLSLQPFAMLDWANSWQQRYKEDGNGPFNMGQKRHYSSFLRSEVGLRFFETISFDAWRLVFEQKTSYVNKKPFDIGTVNAFLIGSPGSFTVETLTTPQNAGIAEFAVIFEPTDASYPFGTIAYQGEFSKPYQSQQISLEICWNF